MFPISWNIGSKDKTKMNTKQKYRFILLCVGAMYTVKLSISRGGRGKLCIGASCATTNSSLVNKCISKVLPLPEKSVAEIRNFRVNQPVKSM